MMVWARTTGIGACVLVAAMAAAGTSPVVAIAADGEGRPAAATAVAPARGPLLGSEAFRPTPRRPVGWRGDWTGRFRGATPPTVWTRRVKGITTGLRYQASKPAGRPGGDSRALEYFTLKDWLVAGPYPVDDPAKEIDRDFLAGEADVEPDVDAKAGKSTWRLVRVRIDTQSRHDHNDGTCGESNVDFVYVFGKSAKLDLAARQFPDDLDNQVAYAHTYIHSPEDAKVRLRIPFAGEAGKFYLNGRGAALNRRDRGRGAIVALKKGWNRLLVKVSVGKATGPSGQNPWNSRWRVAAYLAPVEPIAYDTRNIAWMTKMTGRSMSAPIVVGDRIFVGSGISDLMCLRKTDGKVLWIRSSTPYDAMTAAQRSARPVVREKVEPLVAKLRGLNEGIVEAINAAVSPRGLPSDAAARLDRKLRARSDAEREIHKAFAAMDRRKYPAMFRNEVSSSNATPCSDGTRVYWLCGGGMKGPGAYVIACFDLAGRRIWSFHEALGAQEHGMHTSPILVDGMLICGINKTLLALDARTGKERWRQSVGKAWKNVFCANSPVPARIGPDNVVLCRESIHRVSDGSQVGRTGIDVWGDFTPIVENGVLINPCQWQGWQKPVSFRAVRLAATGKKGRPKVVVAVDGRESSMPVRGHSTAVYTVASPLCVDGVVYSVEMGGGLTAVDMAAGACLYRLWLDGCNRYNRFLYGVCASPTLAGKHIYVIDDAGYTHVLQPGRQFKEVTHNIIENVHLSGHGGNPCKQESFYTSPFFDGKSLYLRGEEYLYCIRQE